MFEPLTVSEMLDQKMSVSFDQESLEFAINTIVEKIGRSLPKGSVLPPVTIVGTISIDGNHSKSTDS